MVSSRLWIALLGHSHGLWLVSRETTKTDSTRARNMETLSQMYTRIPCTVAQQALGLSESKTVEGIVHPSVLPRVYPHLGAPFAISVLQGWLGGGRCHQGAGTQEETMRTNKAAR